jgi:F-type H+-transporting ATPase subunit delta
MFPRRTARRYARAFFDYAAQRKAVEAVAADMEGVNALLRESAELRMFLGNYLIPRSRRAAVLELLFTGRLSAVTLRLVLFLEHKRRLALWADVGREFLELRARRLGIVRMTIAAPYPLEERQLQAIAVAAGPPEATAVEALPQIDPALRGGFSLRIGDRVVDCSLAAQLRRLRMALAAG